MTALFTKTYPIPGHAAAAVRHHQWLARHAFVFRQPALIRREGNSLSFALVTGRSATPDDLVRLAGIMGDAHGVAWQSDLGRAALDVPHSFADGTPLPSYIRPRADALQRRLHQGHLPSRESLDEMFQLLERTAEGPVAFYKDSNPRNFLITTAGDIHVVDTDDLTLAPFGYDLAKLITTLAMTHGALRDEHIDAALVAYNAAASRHESHLGTTSRQRLDDFLTLHAVLTAPYAGRNGYRCTPPVPAAQPRGHS